jgi:hypothetical protein
MHEAHLKAAVDGKRTAKSRRVKRDDDDRLERIRERAYLLWERGHHGHETDHWLQAEREIDAESAPKKKPKPPKPKAEKQAAKAQETPRTKR